MPDRLPDAAVGHVRLAIRAIVAQCERNDAEAAEHVRRLQSAGVPVGTESRAWLERAEISLASGDADSALDALQRADALFQPEHAMFFDAREQKSCVRASGSPAPVVRTRSSF